MVQRLYQALLVQPEQIAPSQEDLEVIGTFNPGVIEFGGNVVFLVRVAERQREQRPGLIALPRWETGRVVTDWLSDDQVEHLDPRVVKVKSSGLLRLTFTSHLAVVYSSDGRSVEPQRGTRLIPGESWEEYGIEDPRIVYMDGRYWITYVAVSRHGAATALASTSDFREFERHGIIFPPENKDVVFFPERVGDDYVALHRPTTAHPFCRPEMWLARSPDMLHWGSHRALHGGKAEWESDRVGGGAPPLKTDAGWLEIYHASRRSNMASEVGSYVAGAMLLDLDDPARVLAIGRMPLWEPDAEYELSGFVPRVVFPTGLVSQSDKLQLFYGAADTYTAMVELRLDDIMELCVNGRDSSHQTPSMT